MLTTYDYYTGIIFRGYTYGTGDAIVKGGRYDHLVGQFGKDSPAVGFALVVDQLLAALGRQKIQVPLNDQSHLILYALPDFSQAVAMAKNLRGQNIQVTLMQKNDQLSENEYMGYCRQNMIQSLITLQGGEKNVKEVG